MLRPKYYPSAWDVVVVLLVVMLAALFVLWAGRTAGAEPVPPPELVTATVASPWDGVFRSGERIGDPPLVEVGTHVAPSTIVGFIEIDVMQPQHKIEVFAGVSGVVTDVMVTDGEYVNAGRPLLLVRVAPVATPATGN